MPQATISLAERASARDLELQYQKIQNNQLAHGLVEWIPQAVMVLNQHRQIVMTNQALRRLVSAPSTREVLGLRPGEALGCINAEDAPDGCGTSAACRKCNAICAIIQAQQGRETELDCVLHLKQLGPDSSMDMRIKATPLDIDGDEFTMVSAVDISESKRRKSLERIFFHDVLNTAGVINGLAYMMANQAGDDRPRHASAIVRASKRLIDEVSLQKDLLAAESGDLTPQPTVCNSGHIVHMVVESLFAYADQGGVDIRIEPSSAECPLMTDPTLLGRVLLNIGKNALEASGEGDAVTVGCRKMDGIVRFWVHNPSYIPPERQKLVFHKSFSTKGAERGLGTYSIHMITSRYLGGKVAFESRKDQGTTFYADLPKGF